VEVVSRSNIVRPGKLVDPHGNATIDEIHFSGNDIDVATRKKRMPDQIPHVDEFRRDLECKPSIIVAFGSQILERLADESNTQMHDV
jgi:hypothetical protein